MHRKLLQVSGKNELRAGLLAGVKRVSKSAALLQSIRLRPDPALSPAIMTVVSSAWRGTRAGTRRARHLLGRVSAYVTDQESSVMIIDPERVTLGGLSGTLPVSITNGLPYPVRVRLHVTLPPGGGRITVTLPPGSVTVPRGADVTLKLHVRAGTVGSTTIQLSLRTPEGAPLPGQPGHADRAGDALRHARAGHHRRRARRVRADLGPAGAPARPGRGARARLRRPGSR